MARVSEILRIENLLVSVEGTAIIKGLNLTINQGEIHVIMGRNGAGKSTLASVIMGHPAYEITEGEIHYLSQPLEQLSVFERARAGMFLSFQYPVVIPGVQVGTFLKKSVQEVTALVSEHKERFEKDENFLRSKMNSVVMPKLDITLMSKIILGKKIWTGITSQQKTDLQIEALDKDELQIIADKMNVFKTKLECY